MDDLITSYVNMYLRERKAQQTRNQRFNMWASVARVWRKQREVFESAIDFICALWEKRKKKHIDLLH